jgi:hypothetical protein
MPVISISLLYFATLSLATADADCSVKVPGLTHNGDCNFLCRSADWKDVVISYLGNYVAHAATVVSRPGLCPLDTFLTTIVVLLFPGAGIMNAIEAI